MSRPEDLLPPDLFYNDTESAKYTTSSRIRAIQASMTNRALDLLNLSSPSFILDVGCGSGLSGEILGNAGHTWVGMDISPSMLDVAVQRRDRAARGNGGAKDGMDEDEDGEDEDDENDDENGTDGDLFLADMGQGLPFRPGTFDAAISISAIQWLCNVEDTSQHSAEARLKRFFDSLYVSLKRGGRAVCQFYPRNDTQRNMISSAAIRAGFGAGILEDDGGTKNVKVYLVLSVGGGNITGVVEGWEGVDVEDGRRVREARVKMGKGGRRRRVGRRGCWGRRRR
ncbi:18S rRNA (guanine1575-N7)-methyltransferase [Knufia obscura]|uniref:18S rRNA (Guanine1575-N7)-methyltransferase n=1 Tax=Knufia obscura TaxID=1635080 RepID=A0ABR0RTC4_9EURO|nr:18S rRNA (guanine1575-N7)-methyltransferase [Knufia obscura]